MMRVKRIILSAVILFVAFFIKDEFAKNAMQIVAYLIVGYDILYKAFRNIIHRDFLDEFFLMSIATLGAIILGEYFEAAEVMLFYQIGESFQEHTSSKSRDAIESLISEVNIPVHVVKDGEVIDLSPEDVEIGTEILIRPGERVAIDGIILEGSSSINTANLTGEAAPRFLSEGDEILSGMVNLEGALTIKTTKTFEDSAMMKILEMIEDSSLEKSKTEAFITRFAKVYTPLVVLIAIVIAIIPAIFNFMPFRDSLRRGLMMLVVSCPCALLVSVPLSFFGAIGAMSKKGILIKNGNTIENLSKAKRFVFDKTGTLTEGTFKVVAVHPKEYSEEELLKIAAHAESFSNHPIAQSIVAEYEDIIYKNKILDYQEIAGEGITAIIFGKKVLIGNRRLMERFNIDWESCHLEGTVVHIAILGNYQGHIIIADEVKSEAKETIEELKRLGIKEFFMLTGDIESTASEVARSLGLTGYKSELLPKDKVLAFHELQGDLITAYVGDGLNDAPVIASSDLSIAMGLNGADVSIEEADVLLLDDKLSSIPTAVVNSRRAMGIVYQNIIFPIFSKVIVLILAGMGIANMQLAIFSDVGVLIIAVLNAARTMNIKEA